ncbi:MAG: phosphodiester glycosidase family protein [Clostridiaceae bacterium]|nr:phosphodiester glycosidase family protein [Clostridiaceae bacterium]
MTNYVEAPINQPKGRHAKPKVVHRHFLRNFILTLMLIAGLYNIAIFSNIPFIEKWRGIYIETAMGTMTHQWLATAFIPKQIIEQVMAERTNVEDAQNSLSTGSWKIDRPDGDPTRKWSKLKKDFSTLYSEINRDTLDAFLKKNGDCLDEDGYLVIDKAGLDDEDTGIRTIQGDRVLALDTRNGIVILRHDGDQYVSRMAIVKTPSQIDVGLAPEYGTVGAIIADICNYNGAVLGINASGFYDPNGHGNGAEAYGLMISGGEKLCSSVGSNYKMLGFDTGDTLHIGRYDDTSFFRDAVEFKPILVLDGEQMVDGSAGWGIQPRSAIGQRSNGETLLLIVDGRAPGYSVGATVGELAELMMDYGAEQAINLDGGSSSVMWYNGRVISKPSAADKVNGRRMPNGFLVMPAE